MKMQDLKNNLIANIIETQRRFETEASNDWIGENQWLVDFIDGKIPDKEMAYLNENGVYTIEDAANWIGFDLVRDAKYSKGA